MSNNTSEGNIIKGVAIRFRNERLRLKMSQNDVALLCGITSRSVISWENGVKIPSHSLALLALHGFDVKFILTAEKNEKESLFANLKISQRKAMQLLELFDMLNENQQKEIFAAVEEKKRMNELIETVNQLQKLLG
jgi:Helix-turn-helix.